jgi:hypothetical protein
MLALCWDFYSLVFECALLSGVEFQILDSECLREYHSFVNCSYWSNKCGISPGCLNVFPFSIFRTFMVFVVVLYVYFAFNI